MIENIIKKKVCLDENIGLSGSGSGHISETDFTINSISILEENKTQVQVEYIYSTFIITEFTILPDNPPLTCTYKNELTIKNDGTIIQSGQKQRIK